MVAQRNAAFLLDQLRAEQATLGKGGATGSARFFAKGWGATLAKAATAAVNGEGFTAAATAAESAEALVELTRLATTKSGAGSGACAGDGGAKGAGTESAPAAEGAAGTCGGVDEEKEEEEGEGRADAAATEAMAAAFTVRRSRAWLERAAAQGSIDAMVMLGDLHYYGDAAAAEAAAAAAGVDGLGGGVALKGGRKLRQEETGRSTAARWYVAACRASEAGRSRSRADWRGLASDARARWNLGVPTR